ncbi:MAG: DUF2079 domain-containing protein [Candidatus Omnitrophica bacterium]|nr:DUF2079 domain-containing protein [Candidatus Omnitrophota bacterium]
MTRSKILLWGLVGLYVFLFSWVSLSKYFSYSFHDFDLAVYAQGLWNLLHGSLESSLVGIPLFGNHFTPILFLIAPLYALFPFPPTLLILQSLLLGGGAFFVYRIAFRKLGDPLALSFAFSYLFYPALGYVNLFEFHTVSLAIFFLLGALEGWESSSYRRFLIFLGLACLCQEDVSLALVAIGLYSFLKRRPWKWGAWPALFGGGYFVGVVFWVMPHLNPETVNFSLLYSHLGRTVHEALFFVGAHPFQVAALLLESAEKRIFVFQLLAPLSFLPFLDPRSFLLSLPFFLEQLLSRRVNQHLLIYHYTALLIPFLYYAAIEGAARLLSWRKFSLSPRSLFFIVFFAALVMNAWTGPHFHLGKVFYESRRDLLDEKRDLLVRQIPEAAPVMATFEFQPHLAHRKELYSFHHVYTRTYTLSNAEYLIPETIQYLLVDFNDPLTHGAFYFSTPNGDRYAKEFLEEGPFRVVRAFQDIVLFERGQGERLFRVETGGESPPLLFKDREGKVGLSRWNMARELGSGEALPITFEWHCLRPAPRRYGILLDILDGEGKRIRRQYHSLCYRLYPTERWKKGERIIEKYILVLPPSVDGKRALWKIVFRLVDERLGKVLPSTISLGTVEAKRESL